MDQSQSELLQLLAYAAAHSVNAVEKKFSSRSQALAHADQMGRALNVDMHDWFETTAESYFSHVNRPTIQAVVAEVRGEVVGGMAGAVTEQWFSNDLIAYDYSIFVEPSRRNGVIAVRLIQTFQEWARIKGAKQIYMGIGTGVSVEGTTRLYESQGLRNIGPLLMMEI